MMRSTKKGAAPTVDSVWCDPVVGCNGAAAANFRRDRLQQKRRPSKQPISLNRCAAVLRGGGGF